MILLISINCGANNVYNEASHHAAITRTTKRIYRKRMGILVLANRKHVWVNFVPVNYIDAPMYREKVPKYWRTGPLISMHRCTGKKYRSILVGTLYRKVFQNTV